MSFLPKPREGEVGLKFGELPLSAVPSIAAGLHIAGLAILESLTAKPKNSVVEQPVHCIVGSSRTRIDQRRIIDSPDPFPRLSLFSHASFASK